MNDTTNLSKAVNDLSEQYDVATFQYSELSFKSGKRVLAKICMTDDQIILYMPMEYQISPDRDVSYRKLFATSDSLMFAFPIDTFDGYALMSERWIKLYDRMCEAYIESDPADPRNEISLFEEIRQ